MSMGESSESCASWRGEGARVRCHDRRGSEGCWSERDVVGSKRG